MTISYHIEIEYTMTNLYHIEIYYTLRLKNIKNNYLHIYIQSWGRMESFIYLIIKKNTISILKCKKKKKKNLSLEGSHMHGYNFADVFLRVFYH
jgi:hypothetical protein